MQSRTTRRQVLAVALILVAGLAGARPARRPSTSPEIGPSTSRPTRARGTPAISFKQDGETITGTYVGTFGSATLKGTVKGTAIEFSFTADAQGQAVDSVYKGTVEKDTMKGTVAIAGGQIGGTFTASRKK